MFNFFKACSFDQLCEMLRAICRGYGCYWGSFLHDSLVLP